MAIPAPAPDVKPGAPEWLVTFADLMSLLLTFFVLLLSFSTVEEQKFNAATGSIRSAFGMHSEISPINRPTGSKILPSKTQQEAGDPNAKPRLVVVRLRQALEKSGMQDHGRVRVTERGTVLELDGELLFDSGRSDLKQAAAPVLDSIADVAQSVGGRIEIEGHTDDVPIATSRFPSNWELSAARAGAAVRYLSDHGVGADRLSAVGYADTRPIVSNDSPEHRARNRRVEFLFVKADAS